MSDVLLMSGSDDFKPKMLLSRRSLQLPSLIRARLIVFMAVKMNLNIRDDLLTCKSSSGIFMLPATPTECSGSRCQSWFDEPKCMIHHSVYQSKACTRELFVKGVGTNRIVVLMLSSYSFVCLCCLSSELGMFLRLTKIIGSTFPTCLVVGRTRTTAC